MKVHRVNNRLLINESYNYKYMCIKGDDAYEDGSVSV